MIKPVRFRDGVVHLWDFDAEAALCGVKGDFGSVADGDYTANELCYKCDDTFDALVEEAIIEGVNDGE